MSVRLLCGFAFAFVALLGGCVLSPVYEGRYRYSEGWREGRILQVGTDLAKSPIVFDCRKEIGAGPPGQVYGEVSYQRAPRRRHRQIVPIPTVKVLEPGDFVYVKMWDCSAPVPKRVVR